MRHIQKIGFIFVLTSFFMPIVYGMYKIEASPLAFHYTVGLFFLGLLILSFS
jgi:hypothetical protein